MTSEPVLVTVDTRHGPAVAHVHGVDAPRGALVLGHGAGGGVRAPDLVAVTAAARDAGLLVALVEQPYRVAGRRTPPRAPVLDAAWTDVVDRLRTREAGGLPLVVGGRSSGARVACRTAAATGAAGVLCLAFPLRPAGTAGRPERPSRLPELDGAGVPVLVVQGERDPFGVPPGGPGRTVVTVAGDHALRRELGTVARVAGDWLDALLGGRGTAGGGHRPPRRPVMAGRDPGAVDSPAAFAELLDATSPQVRAIVERVDRLVRDLDPDVVQVVWTHQRTVGYGVGPRKSSEHYCYLDVYDRHVNVGCNEGALLDDPGGLLGGTGARFRSMRVTDAAQLDDPGLADLLRQARTRRLDQRGG